MILPDRSLELELLSKIDGYLAGVDEVGRGGLAGPVSVGIALVGHETSDDFPALLRDSKLLSARQREAVVPEVKAWVAGSAVGHAEPDEIDKWGIVHGLQLAAARAMEQLADFPVQMVLLDGKHDWWSASQLMRPQLPDLPVVMKIKADATCAVVAGASVIAKVARDALMVERAAQFPGYDWEHNKGYSSPRHIEGLAKLGASVQHRRSWKLPGLERQHERTRGL